MIDITHKEIEESDTICIDGIEFQKVKHGEWIFQRYDDITGNADYECSVCHHGDTHVPIVEVNYCWHCGARMDQCGSD